MPYGVSVKDICDEFLQALDLYQTIKKMIL